MRRPNIGGTFKARKLGHFRDEAAYQRYCTAYDTAFAALPVVPAQTWDIDTSFGSVRVYRFGADTREPMLLLPGRAAASPMWAGNLPGLVDARGTYCIDLLGEPGLSVQTRPVTGDADHAAWLDELIAALPVDRVHLVGLSFGGWTALNLAGHRPGRLASVTVLDPVNTFGRITWKVVVVSLGAVIPGMPGPWRRKLMSWIAGGAEASDADPVAALIASGLRDFAAMLPQPTYPSDERLRSITVPALAVIAGRSIIHNPAKAAERAHRLLPTATVETWPLATHALNGEFPERIASTINTFVGRH
ncbi:alpha/beta fold hydrolase [Actinoplanes sp. CA-051413]|uniref:alpha/beta fold hydrolase n=1 Tax=Actinoplanes sp. CA-051413 TaxID=3239899 RepID=UPI003D9553F3